ncbi:MAG: lytic transglycosylase domain-containing protein [Roseburia sp.]|nr:lytic transglycosylase domain-containing protein [Roseburia sp.]
MKRILVAASALLFTAAISASRVDVPEKEAVKGQDVCETAGTAMEETGAVQKPDMTYAFVQACAEDTYISEEYQRYCVEIGEMYHICPELLMAMIEQESSGRTGARNDAGDTGLLQINPKWHYDRMEKFGVTDLYDPYSNILVAADYLAELFRDNGEVYLVLMKYNMPHSNAKELFDQGIYSEYALQVAERSWELERIHSQEGGFTWERR